MKRFFNMLVLTPREQRVVIAIVLVVMLAAAMMHYRMVNGKRTLLRLKTMDTTGDAKARIPDEAGPEPTDDNPQW